MITLISGTNRPDSNTSKVTAACSNLLNSAGAEHRIFNLQELPRDFAFSYLDGEKNASFRDLLDRYILPSDKFIAVIPEYNGSFPGIFKLLLDAIHPKYLQGKKMAMIGVATGRAGNLRGIDSLTGALHYLGITVYPKNLPISLLREKLDAEGNLTDEGTLRAMKMQIEGFIGF